MTGYASQVLLHVKQKVGSTRIEMLLATQSEDGPERRRRAEENLELRLEETKKERVDEVINESHREPCQGADSRQQ